MIPIESGPSDYIPPQTPRATDYSPRHNKPEEVVENNNKMDKHTQTGSGAMAIGGCEGPDAMYVKLISSDGHEFIVKRDHALNGSDTIKCMLSGPGQFAENETNEVNFREIPSHVLQGPDSIGKKNPHEKPHELHVKKLQ